MSALVKSSTALCILLFIVSCTTSSSEEVGTIANGGCDSLFGFQACTWAAMENGQISEFGATIPLAGIEAAPADEPMVWPPATAVALDIPSPAEELTGMTHVTVDWEAMGHTPVPFLIPHFDFHFYYAQPAFREAIDCSDETKPARPPAGYILPDEALPPEMVALTGVDVLVGICVPEMGMHAVRLVDAEKTEPFEATMIIGYYDGDAIFLEPMISRETLLQRQSFSLDIPEVPGLTGQPRVFRADYDASADAYNMILAEFSR